MTTALEEGQEPADEIMNSDPNLQQDYGLEDN